MSGINESIEEDKRLFRLLGQGRLFERVLDRNEASEAGISDTFMPFAPLLVTTDGGRFLYLANDMGIRGTRLWAWNGRERDDQFYTVSIDEHLFFYASTAMSIAFMD